MKTAQIVLKKIEFSALEIQEVASFNPHLVFVFGSNQHFKKPLFGSVLKKSFPNSTLIGCTTAGEISNKGVTDNTLVVTGVQFKEPNIRAAKAQVVGPEQCFDVGRDLAQQLLGPGLKGVFVLAPGVDVNGTPLVEGLKSVLGDKIPVTGGLAGDQGAFRETWTLIDGEVSNRQAVAIGFYGESLTISTGSLGGWKAFGPVHKATRAEKNVLFELDGQPALSVYKKYLGDDAKGLPLTGLRYPFAILKGNEDQSGLIRTILGVDELVGSLTFAGDIPQDSLIRMMHTDNKGLISGAKGAAEEAKKSLPAQDGVGILISCVGRKLFMGINIDDEVEIVQNTFGKDQPVLGFYSHGEISPSAGFAECRLHNQTMTITWLTEKA